MVVEPLSLGSQFVAKLNRRSGLEISMDMLSTVKDGSERPTQIMYRANLSWRALQTHFKALVEGGMIKWVENGHRKRYEITDKGRAVLESYSKIKKEIDQALRSSHENVPNEVSRITLHGNLRKSVQRR